MQQSTVITFSRESATASRRQWLEERSKQATSLMRDFQEWIDVVSCDGGSGTASTATQSEIAQRYIRLVDQTFKELVTGGAGIPALVTHRSEISGEFQRQNTSLKKVA